MQANAKQILNAANQTALFTSIKDRAIIRQDDFPAFNILSRHKEPEAQDTGLRSYKGPWHYDCMINIPEDREQADDEEFSGDDYGQLENLFTAVMDQLLGDGIWELTDGPEYGQTSVISGRETLGVAFTLTRHQVDRYGN